MAEFKISNVRLKGISACLPSQFELNSELSLFSEKEKSQLIKNIGIDSRRVAPKNVSARLLGQEAANLLLENLKWSPESIDLLIFVSQTPDHLIPGSSSRLASELGMGNSCMTFDINQGCAGYIYGMASASALISSGSLKRALLIVSDTINKVLDPEDKSTRPIFSDAGTATALEFDASVTDWFFDIHSNGYKYDVIITENAGFSCSEFIDAPDKVVMEMNGHEIFTFGLKEIVPSIQNVIKRASWDEKEINSIVLHQANKLINDSIRKKLKMELVSFPETLSRYGNTSCATIPLTIVSECSHLKRNELKKCILTGFGVGLSWGSLALELESLIIPEIKFLD